MNQVIYTYNSVNTAIQCQSDEKMKNVNERLKQKLGIQNSNIYYLYNGSKVNEELTFNELSGGKHSINIILYDKEIQKVNESNESEYIICPKCNEIAILDFKDYKFNLKCKNGHNIQDILIKEYKIEKM